ncbi:MAG: conjugal transfer protein TraM [Muricauda sp.]|nr:conjugative transposon protein TraM [Allomuricauda sp.]MBC30740.1 conjugal transfer protein TraM [Allomuricauda sp.]|tara:strand:+ start:59766 stop:60671 length:906 start_codon:yes stop_codon:yes gene_type:complete
MENKKNKIVFGAIILLVLLFLASYTYLVIIEEEEAALTQPTLPEWQETESDYGSKLEALEALKEERNTVPPSAYPEHMVDDKGFFNPDYMEYEKQRIIDSIYQGENFKRPEPLNELQHPKREPQSVKPNHSPAVAQEKSVIELGLRHQLFFAANPKASIKNPLSFPVEIVGDQILRKDSRVRMQLSRPMEVDNQLFPKNTTVWGTVSFKPNRVLVTVFQIGNTPVTLEAHDLQDGLPGIYVENSFRAQATTEVVDDVVQDINIVGVPQVRGLKSIFQRSNRHVKVTLLDGHQLLLKPKNQN